MYIVQNTRKCSSPRVRDAARESVSPLSLGLLAWCQVGVRALGSTEACGGAVRASFARARLVEHPLALLLAHGAPVTRGERSSLDWSPARQSKGQQARVGECLARRGAPLRQHSRLPPLAAQDDAGAPRSQAIAIDFKTSGVRTWPRCHHGCALGCYPHSTVTWRRPPCCRRSCLAAGWP